MRIDRSWDESDGRQNDNVLKMFPFSPWSQLSRVRVKQSVLVFKQNPVKNNLAEPPHTPAAPDREREWEWREGGGGERERGGTEREKERGLLLEVWERERERERRGYSWRFGGKAFLNYL